MSDLSKFQFNGYSINKSLIELQENSNFDNIKIGFKVSGLVNQNEKIYFLNLSVSITNEEKDLKIQVDAIGKFKFESVEKIEDISSFFYTNSSAILFPYIRAYISTLTNLSGNRSITLPTMNLTNLAEELKSNTKIV
ncbi:protein-export chaperone SecB [Flavobacterium psychrophilum]|jgi:preprotein translocase subunit SecB